MLVFGKGVAWVQYFALSGARYWGQFFENNETLELNTEPNT